MTKVRCWSLAVALAGGLVPIVAPAQVDPVRRELFQLGYNAALEGHSPLAAYVFYYRNQPGFLQTNLTLRLAVSPTFLDSELGIRQFLGEHTDLGVGIAGGGFADSYNEIRQGKFLPEESFDGYSGEVNLSLYHLFNPGQEIPLNGVLRGIAHYSFYDNGPQTAPNFTVPENMGIFSVRTGLRWGGKEPVLYPALAMELSAWYQGEFRTAADTYGFGDRSISPVVHLFWGEAMLAYTLPKLKHSFSLALTTGTSIDADRLSAYRMGAFLPMSAEYPLSLPGYYYQELSARSYVLLGANYIVPLDQRQRWNVSISGATALVDYLPGLEQPGNWNSGVAGGVFYTSPTWRVMVGYGYGFNAIRSHGRGAQSIGVLLQLDLAHAKEAFYGPTTPSRNRGFQRVLGVFGG